MLLQRLVQQVVGFGVEGSLELLSEGIAGVYVHIVHLVVVAVVEGAFSHFVDEVGSEVIAQAQIQTAFLKV